MEAKVFQAKPASTKIHFTITRAVCCKANSTTLHQIRNRTSGNNVVAKHTLETELPHPRTDWC